MSDHDFVLEMLRLYEVGDFSSGRAIGQITVRLKTLRSQRNRALALLREVEWDGYDDGCSHDCCQWCWGHEGDPHEPNCRLAALLREVDRE